MRLTVKIKQAQDGRFDLQIVELPELEVCVKRVAEIPEAVRDAAASSTGRPPDDFDVVPGY